MTETILFDLDGTLTDPGLGITNAAMYALKELGYPVPEREALYAFIGPPLHDSFSKYYGMTPAQAEQAVALFRVYFKKQGIHENQLFPGIPEMLEALRRAGKRLVLATSKPEEFARETMAYFGLDRYVPELAGATMGTERSTKGDVIAYALERFQIDPSTAVMVGDREYDILGAKENGLPAIGVSFGYGSRDELGQAGAIAIADSPAALTKLLLEE